MAGHPQENPWAQQGHGYSHGEPDYGPVYEQPGAYDQQPDAYEQPGGAEETAYDQPVSYEREAEQPRHDRQPRYDQGAARRDQRFQRDQRAEGRPWEKWQLPKPQAGRTAPGQAGFVSSLFDFGFTSFVTPKIIKAVYFLVTVWTVLWAIYLLFVGNHLGHIAGLLFVLIIVDPILILLSLGLVRVVLEFFMVTLRMQEDLRALREQAAGPSAKAEGGADPGTSSRDGA